MAQLILPTNLLADTRIEELKSLERDLQTALKEKETEATAAASASAILPEGLGKSASGRSWWNIF